MKNNLGAVRVAVLFIAVFFSSMTGYIAGVNSSRSAPVYLKNEDESNSYSHFSQQISQSPAKGESQSVQSTKSSFYILKEHSGVVALFFHDSNGSEKLWQTYDIHVNLLPEADREQLKKGIQLSSISEALEYIENFSS